MTEGTWDEQEDKLVKNFLAGKINAKILLEEFTKIDRKRTGYIK